VIRRPNPFLFDYALKAVNQTYKACRGCGMVSGAPSGVHPVDGLFEFVGSIERQSDNHHGHKCRNGIDDVRYKVHRPAFDDIVDLIRHELTNIRFKRPYRFRRQKWPDDSPVHIPHWRIIFGHSYHELSFRNADPGKPGAILFRLVTRRICAGILRCCFD
jgi:hypothetical protein